MSTLKERYDLAMLYCDTWLADGNEFAEKGDSKKAQACYDKSQFWLDRANKLRDRMHANGDKP